MAESSNSLGNAYIKIRADMTQLKMDLDKAQEKIKFLETPAGLTSKGIEKHFKNLGISSAAHFDELRSRAQKSFDLIKNHANSTAEDIVKAEKAKYAKLASIYEKQYGEQKRLVDSAVKHQIGAYDSLGAYLKTFALTYVTGYLIKSFSDAVRSAEELNNKMRIAVGGGSDALGSAYKDLVDMSNRTFTALTDNVSAYQKAVVVLGLSHKDSVSLIETWNKTLKVSGATTQEASAATVQFFQAIASNRLGGDELRSIMEQNSYFAKMLAKELGITTGELRKWGEEGKLSADVVMGAMSRMSESVNKDFGNVSLTINGALTQLDNTVQMIMASTAESSDGVHSIARAISDLAKTIEENRAEIEAFLSTLIDFAAKAAEAVGWVGKLIKKNRINELAAEIKATEQAIHGLTNGPSQYWGDVSKSLAEQQERLKKLKHEYGVTTGVIKVFKINQDETKNTVEKTTASQKANNDTTKDAEKAAKAQAKALKDLTNEYIALGRAMPADTWLKQANDRYDVQSRTLDALIQQEKEYIEEGKALGEDMWLTHEQGRKDATDRAIEYEIKADEEAAKEIQKIYDEMWNGIQESFADTIYDMFDEGLDSWGDFFDSILDLFKKMLANMVAAWLVSGLKSIFTGTGTGFSLGGLFGSESSTGEGIGGFGIGAALSAGWDKITAGVSKLGSALGLVGQQSTVVASGMYEFGAATQAATGASTSASAGVLALTGALIPLGAAIGGMMGLDEVLFGGDRPAAYDMLHEWAAGVRDLTDAELTYYKAAYMSDFTGIDAQAMKDSISLQNEYAAYLGLTVDQMDALVQKRAELDIALRQEAGLLDWFNTALVEKSAETIKFELEELLATFQLDPSDEWYRLKIGVDMSGVDPMNINARASGGPVAGNKPYIVGEVGPELFVPQQSGHILSNSNMRKLMAMGVKGYASGTTDLASWRSDYERYISEEMGLITEFGKELLDLSDKFKSLIAEAEELGASAEEIAAVYEDWAELAKKIAQDTIDDISSRAKELSATGPTTLDEQLAADIQDITDEFYEMWQQLEELAAAGYDVSGEMSELYNDWVKATQNAVEKVKKTILSKFDDINEQIKQYEWQIANPGGTTSGYYASEIGSLYTQMLANPTLEGLSNAADLLTAWYSAAVSEAESSASSVNTASENTASALNDAADALKSFQDSIDDLIQDIKYSDFNRALPMAKAQEAKLDYDTLKAAAFSASATQDDLEAFRDFAKTYLQTGMDAYKSSTAYQEIYAAVMADLDLLKTTAKLSAFESAVVSEMKTSNSYASKSSANLSSINAAFKNAQKVLEDMLDKLTGTSEGEAGTNPGGWTEDEINNRYYTTSEGAKIYDTWSYLGRTPGELLGQIALSSYRTAFNTAQISEALGKTGVFAEGGLVTSPTLGMIGEAGYPEAVIPLKGGYVPVRLSGGRSGGLDDPEVKNLLKGILAAQDRKQNVTLTLENGKELKGYIRATADELDQARVERNIRSRLYH